MPTQSSRPLRVECRTLGDRGLVLPRPLEFQRREIVERGVSSAKLAPGFQPLEDRDARSLACGSARAIEQFAFDRSEETLGERVVVRISSPANRGQDAGFAQTMAAGEACVRRVAVGVRHQPRRGPASAFGLVSARCCQWIRALMRRASAARKALFRGPIKFVPTTTARGGPGKVETITSHRR
jgi:hypothetical protein